MQIIVNTELPGIIGFEVVIKSKKDREALQKIVEFFNAHKDRESEVAIIMARNSIEKGGILRDASFVLKKQ